MLNDLVNASLPDVTGTRAEFDAWCAGLDVTRMRTEATDELNVLLHIHDAVTARDYTIAIQYNNGHEVAFENDDKKYGEDGGLYKREIKSVTRDGLSGPMVVTDACPEQELKFFVGDYGIIARDQQWYERDAACPEAFCCLPSALLYTVYPTDDSDSVLFSSWHFNR